MPAVSGYILDLYCDNDVPRHTAGYYDYESADQGINYDKFPVQIVADGKNCYAEVRRIARKRGWIFHKDGTTTCPLCNKDKK